MKPVKMFYIDGCPYCRAAREALADLEKNEKYSGLSVELINESEHPDIADRYDYYHVPTVFVDEKKAFETQPGDSADVIRENLVKALDSAL